MDILQVHHLCAGVYLRLVLCLPAHPLHVDQTLVGDVFLRRLHLVPEAGPSDGVGPGARASSSSHSGLGKA